MKRAVTFQSTRFTPFLPEEAQVNPQVYGAELTYWLAEQLARHNVVTSYPNFEDWGWFLEYITTEGDEYWLCCSNSEGRSDAWLCYLEPKPRGLFGRNKPPVEGASAVLDTLRTVLDATPEVQNAVWHDAPY